MALFSNPIFQALVAGIFTWLCTLFGSAFVFLFKEVNDRFLAIMQGFAAGVMIAASFWSLLAPALEYAESSASSLPAWLPVAVGFVVGGLFLRLLDYTVPHTHLSEDHGDSDNRKLPKTTMLFLAVTIHNIPEGLALGVAFAAASIGNGGATLTGAIALAIGIGLQNIPEGSALSLPLYADGRTKRKAFQMGQLSAIVEPVSAVIGAAAVLVVQEILPYALAFAAGAMIFVVVEQLIPESQSSNHTDDATLALIGGFVLMMILDVALG
ncbi:ZIP family metal transporter [Ruoffia tabacinasalis]|uniref:ZIP family metal transporter n=1 Tax=Ruoffia tabacinasalis TaxID=87458 RepID=A0ABS0LHW0_9LACT|nr:ZIP family metal transporter [Ruoffia tabacinasalis]MBG9977867.1 ZIP family metal transporter [Ruoffia tabacinasalis]